MPMVLNPTAVSGSADSVCGERARYRHQEDHQEIVPRVWNSGGRQVPQRRTSRLEDDQKSKFVFEVLSVRRVLKRARLGGVICVGPF
jgi:hypothetical protein